MEASTLERPMPKPKTKGRPRKPGGEGTPVRIDSTVVNKARFVTALSGVPLSDYLSGLLAPLVDRDFVKAGKELAGGPGE